jgi:hypothetical protein
MIYGLKTSFTSCIGVTIVFGAVRWKRVIVLFSLISARFAAQGVEAVTEPLFPEEGLLI